MSIVKVNTGLFFALSLAISGGIFAKKLLTPHPRFHPLLSKSLKQYPGLKFHPHSEHYIYNFDTVEKTDKPEFKALASKLSQLPSNFPSKITLETVSAPSVVSAPSDVSSEFLNPGELLSDRELYLISKYWLQLLPQLHPELLKCLAGPTEKPKKNGDQFANNCPSEIRYLNQNTEESSSPTTITNPNFNIPYTLYAKLQKCANSQCQAKSKDCYCTEKSCEDCSDANSCKCFDISELTIGPDFFISEFSSKFSYPSQPQSQSHFKPQNTFNATGTSKPSNPKPLPHFSFPLPHSSHIPSKTQNSIADSEKSLQNPIHWPQKIQIRTNWSLEINGTGDEKVGNTSLDALVSKLLDSPSSFETSSSNEILTKNSPTQLFFVRYLATLYALLWSYSPHTLPLFPSDSEHNILSEFDIPSPTPNTPPLFNIHPQTQSTQK